MTDSLNRYSSSLFFTPRQYSALFCSYPRLISSQMGSLGGFVPPIVVRISGSTMGGLWTSFDGGADWSFPRHNLHSFRGFCSIPTIRCEGNIYNFISIRIQNAAYNLQQTLGRRAYSIKSIGTRPQACLASSSSLPSRYDAEYSAASS